VMLGPDALSPPDRPDTTELGAFLFNDVAAALDEGTGIRLRFPQVQRVRFFGDLGGGLDPDVVVFDYAGNVMRAPIAWLYLKRAEAQWSRADVAGTAQAMGYAEEATRRWMALPPGPWRQQAAEGIRAQALGMLQIEATRSYAQGDARAVARDAYGRALAKVAELAR
jgi:hypothetical protein